MGIYHPTNPGETRSNPGASRYAVIPAHQVDGRCRESHSNPYRLRPDIVFISASDTELSVLEMARAQLPEAFPPVQTQPSYALQMPAETAAFVADIAATARLVIVRMLGGEAYFRDGLEQLRAMHNRTGLALLALPGDNRPDLSLAAYTTIPPDIATAFFAYCVAGGATNYAQGLRYLSDQVLGTNFGAAPPVAIPWCGLYHPDATDLEQTAALDVETFGRTYWQDAAAPLVGLLFYRAYWQSRDLAVVNAVVRALEATSCRVLPVFCYSLRELAPETLATYFGQPGEAAVSVIVSLVSYALAEIGHGRSFPQARGTTLEALVSLGIPVIQGLTVRETQANWEASPAGLSPLDAAMKVVMAEFDGRIVATVVGVQEPDESGISRQKPIQAQVEALAALAARWARLRSLPNRAKRLSIVLTNFANRNGRVGSAVGLDTPASVLNLLRALRERGYEVGDLPPDGDTLMAELLAQGGYEFRLRPELHAQAQSARFRYRVADYQAWFATLPAACQAELQAVWGEAPGDVLVNGDEIYIAGRRYGNVVVLIQPPRGYGENPQAIYHSGELVPPHHYLAVYRWLRSEFGVDAVIHCGKHGTVEWLPGKSLGLSEHCYPQLVLPDTPVLYPFLVGDPGEGLQAKRRWHAALISHLPPPMTQAEVDQEGELAPLQALLAELARAEQLDPDKRSLILDAIWEAVVAANLHRDLGYVSRPDKDAMPAFLKQLDGYLCNLGELQIRHGLHILGEAPTGERLVDFLCALVRQPGTDYLGLPAALAHDLRLPANTFDLDATTPWAPEAVPAVLAALAEVPITNVGRLRRALDAAGRNLVWALAERDFELAAVATLTAGQPETARTLTYLAQEVLPRVRQAPDEIRRLLNALEGHSIPPGPSGAPTRGRLDVLPTGRNFYAVDMRAIPSRFAWQVGQQLGNTLVANYVQQQGCFPEVIGMTLWGTANMRTQGDDVAQALWLLGVEPVWNPVNQRLTGLQRLPVEQLQRPRIDVVIRVSGFFRDAFPNVLALLDEAVNLAADADEPDEWNYVRKRVRAEEQQRLAAGLPPDIARRQARFRVFSNRPGVYGVGILAAIAEGVWTNPEDLAEIYLRWSGYAYTAQEYGVPAEAILAARLAACDAIVQNQDNREHDILDSDDYMQFQGGMAAAVRNLRGAIPPVFLGDSSDPARPRLRSLQEELRRVVRARVTNPKWLRSIQDHGYKGALEMAATVDYLFGYGALTGLVEDWMYERVAETYLFDEGMAAFLRQSNPWAQRDMAARLLEAARRSLWEHPSAITLKRLTAVVAAAEDAIQNKEMTSEGKSGEAKKVAALGYGHQHCDGCRLAE
ncbi:MAG: cobaltochelatase subunit CobN [Acidobacteriota bacterium]